MNIPILETTITPLDKTSLIVTLHLTALLLSSFLCTFIYVFLFFILIPCTPLNACLHLLSNM
ncbi:hypothetical protein BDV25DRAFT_161211 [Aspergillus avenaceus]|uniref:Uncharacterized protein n=1 Tax=Aspergillus avenaceus TaxID=36643 RepID=A0A5N6TL33_ASPAV|nr:hypothetical protein BDV25DRAFT_161211 [Aspergillus avenaceus]